MVKWDSLLSVKIEDDFWGRLVNLTTEEMIPYQWEALNDRIPDVEPSHAVENFRIAAGLSNEPFKGMVFQDSDVAKWIEAASYSLIHKPNHELESTIDELVELIAKAQQDDGYLNTYFTVVKPEDKWTHFSHDHELYCAGHLIEAAVAYYKVTKKRTLLDIVCRLADHIDRKFGSENGKKKAYPGHPEIEMALIKLYEVTQEDRYLRLSEFFVDERGKKPNFLLNEPSFALGQNDRWFGLDYHQAHKPVQEQTTAEGHAVRAMYLYSALADLADRTGRESLLTTVKTLWENVVSRRMYITGGVGSQGHGERFTFDYDLPNDVAYAETCASIGLIFWAFRMLKLEKDRQYADVLEQALYNGVLSGMSFEGNKFFYVNPLEVFPEAALYRHDHNHVEPERVGWFGCACCPPNLARLIASIGNYIYMQEDEKVYVHLYIGSRSTFNIEGTQVVLNQKNNYPWEGNVRLEVDLESPIHFDLFFRIPSWCNEYEVLVNGTNIKSENLETGYLKISREWNKGDCVELDFNMPIRRIRAHPQVRDNSGKVALQKGPLVYCFEEIDNGKNLHQLVLPQKEELVRSSHADLFNGITMIKGQAQRLKETSWSGNLYDSVQPEYETVTVQAVPYFLWGNRNPGEMVVWIRERE